MAPGVKFGMEGARAKLCMVGERVYDQEVHSGQREQPSTIPEGSNSLVYSGNSKLCSVT